MELAPIVLFTYNRPVHTLLTLKSLMKNDLAKDSVLFIYSDGSKLNADPEEQNKIAEVRKIIKEVKWCKEVHIIESPTNKGLATSIVDGVTEIINKHQKIIVLEDDLVLSPGFLKYMNDALDLYSSINNVMHISGYMFDTSVKLPETFFYNASSCWGWGTWSRAWNFYNSNASELLSEIERHFNLNEFDSERGFAFQLKANISGELNTWAIKWNASVFIRNGLCLHPRKSLVRNIGFDLSGEHCNMNEELLNQKLVAHIDVFKIPLVESEQALRALHKYNHPTLFSKILRKFSLKN